MLRNNNKYALKRRGERGVGLMFVLFAMLFLSSYILLNINVDRERVMRERADQTAWLINEIAQAARLYVRDQNANGVAAFQKAALCTTPQLISVNNLVGGGYIGNRVGERNLAGTNFVTPFDQTVVIVAANSRINNADCSVNALTDLAASAYIILQPNAAPANLDGSSIAELSSSLSTYGMPVIPPQFDAAGNNISLACGAGGPSTLQWDTGCLTVAQYNFLSPLTPFAANTMGVPAWLSVRGDNRAVFRYEQPENPLAQTMQTDLRMASGDPATCAPLNITTANASGDPTDTVDVASGVCALDDDMAGNNNRRDITNLSTLDVKNMIVSPQGVDVGGTDAGFDLNGNGAIDPGEQYDVVTDGAAVTGNVRSFARTNSFAMRSNLNMIGGDPVLPNPVLTLTQRPNRASEPAQTAPTLALSGNLNTGNLQAQDGNVSNANVLNAATANDDLRIVGSSTVTGGGRGVVINRLGGTANQMTIAGEAIIGGKTYVNDTTTIAGADDTLSLATGRIDTNAARLGGDVDVGGNISVEGVSTISSIQSTASSVNRCYGDCPDRDKKPETPF